MKSFLKTKKTFLSHCIALVALCCMLSGGLAIAADANPSVGGNKPNTVTDPANPTVGGNASNPSVGGNKSGGSSALTFKNPIKATSLVALLNDLLRIVTIIGSIVVVIMIILAGFKYVTARGNSTKISDANKTLTWVVIGGAIILGAQVIARAIQGTITQLGS